MKKSSVHCSNLFPDDLTQQALIYDKCLYQEVALIMLIYDVCLYQEVALVQHSERTATVESVTAMQLLVVSREDFMDIFFSRANGEEPDHITFSR